ncbi:MAG TPA: hypothetical protein PLF40_14905 [Kofleriaceae bacterium]|jgi:hypothetical protein|nr:hypothetical protein [Kofleriaceae bacterium]
MSEHLKELLAAALRAPQMTAAEKEAQRRSFAFGNANIENERVTKQMIDEAAERIKS